MTTMIALVGEQPLPVLLPVLKAIVEDSTLKVTLAHTDRSRRVAENIQGVLKRRVGLIANLLQIYPYQIIESRQALETYLRDQEWDVKETVFNLTGGTKAMFVSAYELARDNSAVYTYLESEHNASVLYRYGFADGGSRLEDKTTLQSLITIDDYLRVHGFNNFRVGHRDSSDFFPAVWQEIDAMHQRGEIHEVAAGVDLYGNGQVDVDMALRFNNQVAIAEVKSGNKVNSLEWIKQLNTAARPATLGTYTKRLGIISRQSQAHYLDIANLQQIQVVMLDEFEQSRTLSAADQKSLRDAILNAFGRNQK